MKKILKLLFVLSILIITTIYIDNLYKSTNILSNVIDNPTNNNTNEITNKIFKVLLKENTLNPIYKLNNKDFKKEKPIILKEPTIYIYNTHQTESYQNFKNNTYDFTPTVITVSHLLEDFLEESGLNVLVEERDIIKVLNERKKKYSYTYVVSREYMEEMKKKYPSLIYFIDIHRDGVPNKSITTTKINNKDYAKIMFLLGQNRKEYKENLNIIKILENDLEKHYPSITRKTYIQPKYDYNQDFNNTTFLIEMGSSFNTMEEVYNSTEALSQTLIRYFKGEL